MAAAAAHGDDGKDRPGGADTPNRARDTFAEQLAQLTAAASGLKADAWTALSASLLAMPFDERSTLSAALAAFVRADTANPKPIPWTPNTAASVAGPDGDLQLPPKSESKSTTKSWRMEHITQSKIDVVAVKAGAGPAAQRAFEALLTKGALQHIRNADKTTLRRLHKELTKVHAYADVKAEVKAFQDTTHVFRDSDTGVCSAAFAGQVASHAQGSHAEMSWTTQVWSRLTAMWAKLGACHVECGVQLCEHKSIKPDEVVALHFDVDDKKLSAEQLEALRVFKKNEFGNFPILIREGKPESRFNAPDRAKLTVTAKICLLHQLKLLNALQLRSARFTQPMPTAVMLQFCGPNLYVGLMTLRRGVGRAAARGGGAAAAGAAAAGAAATAAGAGAVGTASECVAVWFPEVRFDTPAGLLCALNALKIIHKFIDEVHATVQRALEGGVENGGEALDAAVDGDVSVGVDAADDSDDDDAPARDDGDGESDPEAGADAGDEDDGDGDGVDENSPGDAKRGAASKPKADKPAPRGGGRGRHRGRKNAAADRFAAAMVMLAVRFGKQNPTTAPTSSASLTGLRKAAAHRVRQPLGPLQLPQQPLLQTIDE